MNKHEIIGILKETADNLGRIVDSVDVQLPDEERLNLKVVNGRPAFFRRTKDGKQVYVRLSDVKQIRALASGYYEKKMRAAAQKEKKQIESCIRILERDPETSDIDLVAERIPKAVVDNAGLSELTGEGYARRWQEGNDVVKKRRTRKKDDYHQFKTMKGDYVGSKSEVIIADRLFARGIPYHYEVAFTPEVKTDNASPVYDEYGRLAGYVPLGYSPEEADTLHPDFYVLNKRTGKAYFWEHLGKMDDSEYCRKNFNRFMRILDAGYVIGQDLLVTHEDSRHPLMTESIDRIIEKYLQ